MSVCPTIRCRLFADSLGPAGVGVSLDGRPYDSSDRNTHLLEDRQFVLGEGPIVDVLRRTTAVEIPDVADAPGSWLGFATTLLEHAVGAVAAFPLVVDESCVGALTLYRKHRGALPIDVRDRARRLADDTAEIVARHVMARTTRHDPSCGLHHFGQFDCATGVVVHGLGVPPADAAARLRSHAFLVGLPVDEIVRDVIAGRLRFDRN